MRLTVKERILLHLLECGGSGEEPEVSPDLAQEGLARAAGIEQRHVIQFARPLIRDGLVHERMAHVVGKRQRMKVYGLTPSGRAAAIRLRETVKTQVVKIREGGGMRESSLHEVLKEAGTRASLLRIVREVEQAGVLDLETVRHPPETGLVEQLWDAPRVGPFVGRRKELEEVTSGAGGPQIFVVRGIAGIGKSYFAAKACELVRGHRNLFWHRIRPWETSPMVLASLGRFLEALDRPGLASILKRGESQLAAEVLRQDLPDTHAFLVFDDAHEASTEAAVVFRMLADVIASAEDVRILVLTRKALRFYSRTDVEVGRRVREIELGGLDPGDAAALLGIGGMLVVPTNLGRRLAGHPLALELVRTHHPSTPEALVDVRRFVEEEVYRNLSGPERTIMKAGCLYRVPVPGVSLLSDADASYETLLALRDQSLLRAVGEDRYEIHDTIRDFFASTLTPKERATLAAFVTDQLRGMASRASAEKDWLSSIACLANALSTASSPDERCVLQEALGDANERLGDLLAVSASYRAAMALTVDPVTLARLHRKMAAVLTSRYLLDDALAEAVAGFDALGGRASVELGWLHLVRAGIEHEKANEASAEAEADRALRIFEKSGERLGQARAFLEAGRAAAWTGTTSKNNTPASSRRFEEALRLAKSLGDSSLEAEIHLALVAAIGYASSDEAAGMAHLRAIEASSAMSDPRIAVAMHRTRAWFLLRVGQDWAAAESDISEAKRIAGRIHDLGTLADIQYLFALIAADQGRYGDAGRLDEEAGKELARIGVTYHAANAYFSALNNYLAAGDWEGFRRAAAALEAPRLRRGLKEDMFMSLGHKGMQAAIRGDVPTFEHAFAELFRRAERMPAGSHWLAIRVWWAHFYYSVALQSLGRTPEADEHRRKALEAARAAHSPQYVRVVESDFGDRIAETVRRGRKLAAAGDLTASRSASARGSPTPSTSRRSSGRPGSRGGTSGRTRCGTNARRCGSM